MTSVLKSIAEDVVVVLNGETWRDAFTATRSWVHVEDMSNQVGLLRVAVVPVTMANRTASRNHIWRDPTIDVIVQERPDPYTQARLDELAELMQELLDFFTSFGGRRLINVPAQLNGPPSFPGETFLGQDRLVQHREFASVVRTTWSVLEVT